MTDDALATPWSEAPFLAIDVLAVVPEQLLPEQRRSPLVPGGPWGDRRLPVPLPAWWLREQRMAQLPEQRDAQAADLRRPSGRA